MNTDIILMTVITLRKPTVEPKRYNRSCSRIHWSNPRFEYPQWLFWIIAHKFIAVLFLSSIYNPNILWLYTADRVPKI